MLFGSSAFGQSVTAGGYNFTASSKTFNYLTGGTRITAIEVDDAYTTIPIGFPFTFCGVQYTDVTVCSNGWLRFGSGAGSAIANWNYNANVNSGIEPAVYVLYEDINGNSGTSHYEVSGTAPNRVFVWECKDWLWDWQASNPSISFQVWLYEGTGEIECIYKQEAGAVALNSSGGATLGIGKSSTDWQTLNNSGTNPTPSTSVWTSNIGTRPASGQSYMWDPGPACTPPSGLAVNLVNSTNIDFSWNPVTGSLAYEYLVDQTSANPTTGTMTTTNTTALESGLVPNTQYYIHLRNQCAATNFSPWVTLPIKTLPECSIPSGFRVNVAAGNANFSWTPVGAATNYEYIVDQIKADPASAAGAIVTGSPNGFAGPLTEGEVYFVHIRSLCPGNDSSDWSLDSIYAPVKCRVPQVFFNDINTSRAVAYWQNVKTGVEYEYVLATNSTQPQFGTKTINNHVLFPYLDPGTEYFFHIRTLCSDRGVASESEWDTYDFSTFALGIDELDNSDKYLLYPNPAKDNLTFYHKGSEGEASIFDMNGRFIKNIKCAGDATTIDVSALTSGVYTLKYADNNNVIHLNFMK